jgi:hypothetical protein
MCSISGDFLMRFMEDKVALEQGFSEFLQFSSANHHSTIAPYPSVAGCQVYDSAD